MNQFYRFCLNILCSVWLSCSAFALEIGKPAPLFTLKDQDGNMVSLAENKGKVWTVVYFYPKAGTPGCTKQAATFRNTIDLIEKENTVVYGVSTDSVADLKKFQNEQKLNFKLLSDNDSNVSKDYGTKMLFLPMSKRVTFIIDDKLNVRSIDENVDPATDAQKVVKKIKELKEYKSK